MHPARPFLFAGAVLSTGLAGPARSEAAIAYVIPSGTVGNQDFGGTYGMDFDVTSPGGVRVTRLGAFDSNSDGINGTITVGIFDRVTQALVSSPVTFTGAEGVLEGGSRFITLNTPIDLPDGFQGTIAAQGYNANELGGNAGTFLPPEFGGTDDGGGLIAFVGSSRFGNPGVFEFPGSPDGGGVNRYGAGTFDFSAIPEPAAATLLAGASVLLLARRRRRGA